MLQIPKQQQSEKYQVPQFDQSTIKNIESAKGLDVWDSWPLQNADGTVAEYNGYHVVFALAGSPKDADDTSIYMFYQKSATTRSTAGKTRAVSLKTAISSTPTMKS